MRALHQPGWAPADARAIIAKVNSRLFCITGNLDSQPQCPWLVVQGDEDELVDVEETIEWINSLEPGPELVVMEGAEHFFHGRLNDLRETVMAFVAGQLD